MNDRDPMSTLLLLGALSRLLDPRDKVPDREQEMADDLYIASAEFRSLPQTGQEQFQVALDELGALDPNDVQAVFMTVLVKDKAGHYCDACDTVHQHDGITNMVVMIGAVEDFGPMTRTALGYGMGKQRPESENGLILRGSMTYSPVNESPMPGEPEGGVH